MRRRLINDEELIELLKQGETQKAAALHFGVSEAAISKKIRRLLPPPDLDKYSLTQKQKAFIVEKVKGVSNTDAAMKAYDCKDRASAKTLANTLLKKADIQASITELMEVCGVGRFQRVKKLSEFVNHRDPAIGIRGLNMAFKLGKDYPSDTNVVGQSNSFTQININILGQSDAPIIEDINVTESERNV